LDKTRKFNIFFIRIDNEENNIIPEIDQEMEISTDCKSLEEMLDIEIVQRLIKPCIQLSLKIRKSTLTAATQLVRNYEAEGILNLSEKETQPLMVVRLKFSNNVTSSDENFKHQRVTSDTSLSLISEETKRGVIWKKTCFNQEKTISGASRWYIYGLVFTDVRNVKKSFTCIFL
jgi:hypothetical protein